MTTRNEYISLHTCLPTLRSQVRILPRQRSATTWNNEESSEREDMAYDRTERNDAMKGPHVDNAIAMR